MPDGLAPSADQRQWYGFVSRRGDSALLLRIAKLTLRVHADAFRLDPAGYLQALAWRMRGLKVRSRNRIAALAGRSPSAYDLWVARESWMAAGMRQADEAFEAAPFLLVIDGTSQNGDVMRTLGSLPPRCTPPPILIGRKHVDRALCLQDPRELTRFIDGEEAWLCILRAGDRLNPNALSTYSTALRHSPDARLIYSDDDLMSLDGIRTAPHFKPDWNPELFEHHDFVTGAAIVRVTRDTLLSAHGQNWAEALIRDAVDRGPAPVHVRSILHHRLERPQPSIPSKSEGILSESLPSVTAIVPTKNKAELLRTCIEGLERTSYPDIETIVIDNGSDDPATLDYLETLKREGIRVLRIEGPFNYSALNNVAVKHASGNLLCFLNNDIEVIDPDWLALLAHHAVRPDIGAVGARLLYSDGSVQHAGVFTGIGGGAGHGHRFLRPTEPGYFSRAYLPQRVSAVTGACLVVAREKFVAVDGFDETCFPVAFNDVDLCLKLNERGWQSFYEPRSIMIHHESKSRGLDSDKANRVRFAAELAALKRKWHTDQHRDPFHHPHLSPFCEQFLIAL